MRKFSDALAHGMRPASETGEAGDGDASGAERMRALSRLGSGFAHDINNIFQVIRSAIEIVQKHPTATGSEVCVYLDMARRNADRGARLARQILAFSEAQVLNPLAIDANAFVARVVEELRTELGPSVQLDCVLDAAEPFIEADPEQLQAAIRELALNARDATPLRSQVTIEALDAAADSGDGSVDRWPQGVKIIVRDRGVGMPAEVLSRACEPYYTTKERGRAKGLGLAQVHGFVRQSGGELRIRSKPDEGTVVTIYLPKPPETSKQGTAPSTLRGLRVLVVEDELLVNILVEDLLTQLGCKVVASTGALAEALDLAARPDIDLVVLDVNLQGQQAYPVADYLLQRGLPFAFMSGAGHEDTHWEGLPMIRKPIELADVDRQIRRALAQARRRSR